jgi:hypothetical protein
VLLEVYESQRTIGERMENQQLFNDLREIFIKVDPEQIYFPEYENIDEYDFEIEDLMPHLNEIKTRDELQD